MSSNKIKELMIERSRQIAAGAEAVAAITNDWQTILQFMKGRLQEEFLTEQQKEKMKRYNFMYKELQTGKYSKQEVINMNMRLYGIGLQQSYEDFNCMSEIFSSVMHVNKLFTLQMELELADKMMRKCSELMDFKGAAMFQKNKAQLLAMLPEKDENAAALFEGHIVEAVFDPRLIGAPDVNIKDVIEKINAKRKVKIDTSKFDEAEVVNENN